MPAPGRAGVASERRPSRPRRSREPQHVLGDIQTDRGNLHVDGSPHVIRFRRNTLWHFDAGSGRRPPHQTRTLADVCDTAASLSKADIPRSPRDVAEGPIADLAKHLFGARRQQAAAARRTVGRFWGVAVSKEWVENFAT